MNDTPLGAVVADLSGYPDLEYISSIQTSRHYGVYRAISQRYGPCVVKTTSSTPTQIEIEQLRKEYHKMRLCDSENVVSAFDLYEHQSSRGVALVTMECGTSLKSWSMMYQSEKPSLETVLDIGIDVAEGLDHLHRHARLVHGDISPGNVCYNDDTKRALIIDLGAAHGFSEPNTAFTPAYQSPEHVRGSTDHRSDLYSLGVLLFQLYTGYFPIHAKTPDKFRLALLFDTPLAVSAIRDCHPMFAQIIAKLLDKSPEKRYLTAAGLKHDFERLQGLIKTDTDATEIFELATHERPFIFPLPNELIGRTEELAGLDRLFQLCLDQEKCAFCSCSGRPGVGKTALVNAFAMQHRNPFFFDYKFSQVGNTPMQAIIQTVRCDQFSDPTARNTFLDRLRDCDVLRALVDLVPAYDKLIPSSDQIPEGLTGNVSKILYPAVTHVLRETRRLCDLPIVLFFDDVQWIDPGSKGLLSYLLANRVPVLTIVAFRDHSSQSVFTLDSLLSHETMATSKIALLHLSLNELSEESVNELIRGLPLSEDGKETLSSTMYSQTEGNPFFLRFRLSMMAATGALTYDIDSRLWALNDVPVEGIEITTADAVEYCVSVLRTLEEDVSSVLCRLAMMPPGLTVVEYASVLESERGVVALANARSCQIFDVIQSVVLVGLQKNILIRCETGFRFAHDRLQQSALLFADKKEAAEIHYYLGIHGMSMESNPAHAFYTLEHFRYSGELVSDKDIILRLGVMMSDICGFYVANGSHEHLEGMLEFTIGLFERLDTQTRELDSTVSLEVRLLIAHHKIKFLMNELDAAEALFDKVRPQLRSAGEIRDAYHTRISLLINSGSHREAIETTADALSRLNDCSLPIDLRVPEGEPAAIVENVTRKLKGMMNDPDHDDVMGAANSLLASSDEDHNFRTELLISVISSMYLTGLYDLFLYIAAVACERILEDGVTRSAGHAFSVLGFALVAIFGDNFGAEIAMFGKYLVDRFDNQVTTCRAYTLSGLAVIYDVRYENLASRMLYSAYAAGRSAHDILWSQYAVYVLGTLLVFEGVALPDILGTLRDPSIYAVTSGQQELAQRGLRSIMHMASILMGTETTEDSVVFHYSIPMDEVTRSQPLIAFTHGAMALVALYFDHKLEIAWEIISDIVANKLADSSPGLHPFYIFHMYAVVVSHGLLVRFTEVKYRNEYLKDTKEECDRLRKQLMSSTEQLHNLKGLARIFEPLANIADACVLDVIDGKALSALQTLDSVVQFLQREKPEKHYDLIAISQLISAGISKRLNLSSVSHMYNTMAISSLTKWGALKVAKHVVKLDVSYNDTETDSTSQQQPCDSISQVLSPTVQDSVPSSIWANRHISATNSSSRRHGPDFASVLDSAGYITSFSTFEELMTRLCTTLLKQATATRLLLFVKNQKSEILEPTAEATLSGMSPTESLQSVQYSASIVKVVEQLQERVIVHSAQQEAPHCYDPYVQSSGVCSIGVLPISYQGSLIACVYMEQEFRHGAFRDDIIETVALLGHHVASAIVNALLLRDIRSRSAQLEQSHAVLAKALKTKDTILSNTSHELRSPLNGIIGLNEFVLSSDIPLNAEARNCVITTLAMAKQLLHLVSDILDMSRIQEGALKLNYETSSLFSLVKEVFHLAAFTSQGDIRLINDVDCNFPEVIVDPVRLKQVIFNLISNAIKFTPEGTVTISSELLDDKETFLLSVSDTGIGIDPSHLGLIFEQFGQVESYETKQHSGAGLGLSITKQLVTLHGGRIDVFSTVGEGTTFQVFIPMRPSEPSPGNLSSPIPKIRSRQDLSNRAATSFESTIQSYPFSNETGPVKTSLRATVEKPQVVETTDTRRARELPRCEPAVEEFSAGKGGNHVAQASRSSSGSDSSTKYASNMQTTQSRCGIEGILSMSEQRAYPLDDEPLRVLAADDSLVNLKVLTNFLVRDKMKVTTATNGKIVLELLADNKWMDYDVLLLDWMMPVMDGITAARLCRESLKIPGELLPIMFLTAKSDPADLQKGFDAGGTDFVIKPFSRHEIIARTRSLGMTARRVRALNHDSVPLASKLLGEDPFWKMKPATKSLPMFVICMYSSARPSVIDGTTLLRLCRSQLMRGDLAWTFVEVDASSVSFVADAVTLQEVQLLLRHALGDPAWIESQVAKSASGECSSSVKQLITVGIDHRPVTAHLLADASPMLALVESPVAKASALARMGKVHEEILLSDSAKAALKCTRSTKARCKVLT